VTELSRLKKDDLALRISAKLTKEQLVWLVENVESGFLNVGAIMAAKDQAQRQANDALDSASPPAA
jgi:hypothetical protein